MSYNSQYKTKIFNYYTTWSFILNICVLILCIIILFCKFYNIDVKIYNVCSKLITPIIIATIANIIAVFIASQLILTFNFNSKYLNFCDSHQTTDLPLTSPKLKNNKTVSDLPVNIPTNTLIKINKLNFIFHQIPLLFIIFFILTLKILKCKINYYTILYSIGLLLLFFIIWDIIPIYTHNIKTNPINKYKYVYNSAPLWMGFTIPITWVIILFLIYYTKNI